MPNREYDEYHFYFLKQDFDHNHPSAAGQSKPHIVPSPKVLHLPPPHDSVPEYTPREATDYWYALATLIRDALYGLPAIDRQRYERLIAR